MGRLSSKDRGGLRRLLLVVLSAFVVSITYSTAAEASSAADNGAGPRCYVLLGAAPAPGVASPVLDQECAKPGETLDAPLAGTLLVTLYDDINYNAGTGGGSTQLRGNDGACDASGYGFANFQGFGWNDRASSYKVFNSCTYSSVFETANYGGHCHESSGDVSWVGDLNDRISSMWVASSTQAWEHC